MNKMHLERVVGICAKNNAALAVASEVTVYTAGSVVVVYSPRRNKQLRFLRPSTSVALSSVAISHDSNFVAAGQRGRDATVTVWNLGTGQIVARLDEHKAGIVALAFNGDSTKLASLSKDGRLVLWDMATATPSATAKISSKVHAMAFTSDGVSLVTVGAGHFKFWFTDKKAEDSRSKKGTPKGKGRPGLPGRSANLGDLRKDAFVSVAAGNGDSAGKVFAVTVSGRLCQVGEGRAIEKWLDLLTTAVYAVDVAGGHVYVGCADGVVRVFTDDSLDYVTTLPVPHGVGAEADVRVSTEFSYPGAPVDGLTYPDALAVRGLSVGGGPKVAVVYADRSMFVWDVADTECVGKYRSFLTHPSCVWDIAVVETASEGGPPVGSFVTGAADGAIRFWNFDGVTPPGGRNVYCKELYAAVYTSGEGAAGLVKPLLQPDGTMVSPVPGPQDGIRCVRLSPDGRHLASGDRVGNLRVHSLSTLAEETYQEAHDGEILDVEFSRNFAELEGALAAANSGGGKGRGNERDGKKGGKAQEKGSEALAERNLLATCSRDQLIHILDIDDNYSLLTTIDDHSASITAMRFAGGGSRLISASADNTIVFRSVLATSHSQALGVRTDFRVKAPVGSIYGMDVDATGRYIIATGHEDRLSIYSLATGRAVRSYQGEPDGIKVVLDPAGIYAATSYGGDNSVRVYDFFSGTELACGIAHADVVTGMAYSVDCRRLVTVSADGCMFVWRLDSDMVTAMQDRLAELRPSRTLHFKDVSKFNTDSPVKTIPSGRGSGGGDDNTAESAVPTETAGAVVDSPQLPPAAAAKRKVPPTLDDGDDDDAALGGGKGGGDVRSELASMLDETLAAGISDSGMPNWAKGRGGHGDETTVVRGSIAPDASVSIRPRHPKGASAWNESPLAASMKVMPAGQARASDESDNDGVVLASVDGTVPTVDCDDEFQPPVSSSQVLIGFAASVGEDDEVEGSAVEGCSPVNQSGAAIVARAAAGADSDNNSDAEGDGDGEATMYTEPGEVADVRASKADFLVTTTLRVASAALGKSSSATSIGTPGSESASSSTVGTPKAGGESGGADELDEEGDGGDGGDGGDDGDSSFEVEFPDFLAANFESLTAEWEGVRANLRGGRGVNPMRLSMSAKFIRKSSTKPLGGVAASVGSGSGVAGVLAGSTVMQSGGGGGSEGGGSLADRLANNSGNNGGSSRTAAGGIPVHPALPRTPENTAKTAARLGGGEDVSTTPQPMQTESPAFLKEKGGDARGDGSEEGGDANSTSDTATTPTQQETPGESTTTATATGDEDTTNDDASEQQTESGGNASGSGSAVSSRSIFAAPKTDLDEDGLRESREKTQREVESMRERLLAMGIDVKPGASSGPSGKRPPQARKPPTAAATATTTNANANANTNANVGTTADTNSSTTATSTTTSTQQSGGEAGAATVAVDASVDSLDGDSTSVSTPTTPAKKTAITVPVSPDTPVQDGKSGGSSGSGSVTGGSPGPMFASPAPNKSGGSSELLAGGIGAPSPVASTSTSPPVRDGEGESAAVADTAGEAGTNSGGGSGGSGVRGSVGSSLGAHPLYSSMDGVSPVPKRVRDGSGSAPNTPDSLDSLSLSGSQTPDTANKRRAGGVGDTSGLESSFDYDEEDYVDPEIDESEIGIILHGDDVNLTTSSVGSEGGAGGVDGSFVGSASLPITPARERGATAVVASGSDSGGYASASEGSVADDADGSFRKGDEPSGGELCESPVQLPTNKLASSGGRSSVGSGGEKRNTIRLPRQLAEYEKAMNALQMSVASTLSLFAEVQSLASTMRDSGEGGEGGVTDSTATATTTATVAGESGVRESGSGDVATDMMLESLTSALWEAHSDIGAALSGTAIRLDGSGSESGTRSKSGVRNASNASPSASTTIGQSMSVSQSATPSPSFSRWSETGRESTLDGSVASATPSEVASLLERYSDMLVSMVTTKLGSETGSPATARQLDSPQR